VAAEAAHHQSFGGRPNAGNKLGKTKPAISATFPSSIRSTSKERARYVVSAGSGMYQATAGCLLARVDFPRRWPLKFGDLESVKG
jgi:hypothetical protein